LCDITCISVQSNFGLAAIWGMRMDDATEGTGLPTVNGQSGSLFSGFAPSGSTLCPRCDYDLQGLPVDHKCPECHFAYDATTHVWKGRTRHTKRLNTFQGYALLAITGALGLFGIVHGNVTLLIAYPLIILAFLSLQQFFIIPRETCLVAFHRAGIILRSEVTIKQIDISAIQRLLCSEYGSDSFGLVFLVYNKRTALGHGLRFHKIDRIGMGTVDRQRMCRQFQLLFPNASIRRQDLRKSEKEQAKSS